MPFALSILVFEISATTHQQLVAIYEDMCDSSICPVKYDEHNNAHVQTRFVDSKVCLDLMLKPDSSDFWKRTSLE